MLSSKIFVRRIKEHFVMIILSLIMSDFDEQNSDEDIDSPMSISKLCPIICNPKNCHKFLVDRGVLKDHFRCSNKNCRRDMSIETVSCQTTSDCMRWICHGCRRTRSVRDGSFFSKSLRLDKIVLLIYGWAFGIPAYAQAAFANVSEKHTSKWNQYIRDVCSTWLIQNPFQFGGEGKIVQIDESVMAKQKYNVGHMPPGASRWVFGIVDVETRACYMELVEDRSAESLIPIIQKYVLPGTEIWSDCWAAYHSLSSLGYIHRTVNHSSHFKDPDTGVCTNLIEVQWKNCKQKFKAMVGTHLDMIPSYLDEYMWRCLNGKKSEDAFDSIMEQIGTLWPWEQQ